MPNWTVKEYIGQPKGSARRTQHFETLQDAIICYNNWYAEKGLTIVLTSYQTTDKRQVPLTDED